MTKKEEILQEVEKALTYFKVNGKGVSFGVDANISQRELKDEYIKSETFVIENYKGHSIKIIVK